MTRDRRQESAAYGLARVVVRQTLWAVPFALFFGTLYGGTWNAYGSAAKASLVFSQCIGLALWVARVAVAPAVGRRVRGRPDAGLRVGAVHVVAALAGSAAGAVLLHLVVFPGFLGSPRTVLATVLYTLLFVALFTGIHFAIAYYRVAARQTRDLERQRTELARAELRALRAQVDPHFLFNTLNTIAALIVENPRAAEDTTTRLADLFRYTLSASERDHRPFADELAFLRDYLAIERMRFGDRLGVSVEVEPGLEEVPVPSLLLQPLVENAVRHGAGAHPAGGHVTLRARRDGDTLEVTVADDGPGFDPVTPDDGFGLRSVRERLRLAGPPHALVLDTIPGRGTRVTVVLPLVPKDPDPDGGSR